MSHQRETWGGRAAFIVAAISSAIGLGNIWRFPGVAFENGGGAFLIPYLVAFVTAGLPILFLDYSIGHRYRAAPPLAFRRLDRRVEPLGWWQVGVSYLILTYYAVVIAWALSFFWFSFGRQWGDDAAAFFVNDYLRVSESAGLTADFVPGVLVTLLVVWIAAIVVMSLGLRRGLDRANKITLPLLVAVFTILVVYSLSLPGAWDGVNQFFAPDFAALADPTVWIAAYGHIFFSFSIAFGIMLTYSSYMRRRSDLTGSGLVVAFANCSFEILAGIGVFAALGFLAHSQGTEIAGLEGISGPILAFVTFPTLLTEMPGGAIMSVLFFGSLLLAGFTSLLSIYQVVAGAVQDKTGWGSRRTAVTVGILTGVPSVLLFSATSGLNVLDVLDAFVNNIGVTFSAVVMLVLTAWVLRAIPQLSRHLNAISSFRVGRFWRAMVSVVTPVVLGVILVSGATAYIRDGYGEYPSWFVALVGWGSIAFLAVFSFAMSYRRYRRDDAEEFTADDPEELAGEPQARGARGAGESGPEADEGRS
ncbi:sodium-dependent transporter [Leucobacter weissii]|uniref:Sodium-dependent transporter n=1 Tax=Leucobacter weissii TaxID=1983706 RepID=A0A939S9M5_9MICO|nr:sodium-dependent transporter [Leucobacter weissii]MBO1901077.1 sodium-dependent transporter [Leucobacter weissii]